MASVLIAFLPAVISGLLFGKIIDAMLKAPLIICVSLILGGIMLLWVDRMKLTPRYTEVTEIPPSLALKIGLCQCLAMIPGVSRSGATIVGAMLMGADKRTAAEFSFFLAMPTMAGAFAYDLSKHWKDLSADDLSAIAVGFVVAFVGSRGGRAIAARTTSAGMASRCSAGGASSWAAWRSAPCWCSGRRMDARRDGSDPSHLTSRKTATFGARGLTPCVTPRATSPAPAARP